MRKKIKLYIKDQPVEREYLYIPLRYILALLITVLEVLAIVGIVIALCYYVPYFYLLAWATQISCILRIIASDDMPDYKVPWLLVVMAVPVVGFMLYFIFYSRVLKKKYIKRLRHLKDTAYQNNSKSLLAALSAQSPTAGAQAQMLCRISESSLFTRTRQEYFPLGEDMHRKLLLDLETAEKFIFMEYFIIEEGIFWNSILDILKKKASAGVEVRVVYDDIGCMALLPGSYDKILKSCGILAVPFSKLKGSADSGFNNRSHRKITVIDGRIGYTGGVNIADEYINKKAVYGHWKDVGLRLEGEAVKELTKLFLIDYGLNVKDLPEEQHDYFPEYSLSAEGYVIPFGDGPVPIYDRRVGKSVIENMLNQATRYFCAMTPYLVLDDALCQAVENAALRGVTVKLILPGIPDKWLVKELARSHYQRLLNAGVEIYEYTPGFVHAKCYLADDEIAMVGTINMDHRSLVHNFENGVWMYGCECIQSIRKDFADTLKNCVRIDESMIHWTLLQRLIRSVAKIFAPLM